MSISSCKFESCPGHQRLIGRSTFFCAYNLFFTSALFFDFAFCILFVIFARQSAILEWKWPIVELIWSSVWMMVSGARIAAVSYLNTIPFIYGIQHEDNLRAELLLAPPAGCYANYAEGRADIALMPSAMIPTLKSTNIITDYCIGSSGNIIIEEFNSIDTIPFFAEYDFTTLTSVFNG